MEHDSLALRAWQGLYDRPPRHWLLLRYSGRFKEFNANVEKRSGRLGGPGRILFSLSRAYEEVGEEIRVGVLQHLLNRLRRTSVATDEIGLYNAFIRKLADYVETTRTDPLLRRRFDELNHRFFDGYMLTPNLVWGRPATRTLGHYAFATDTITLSPVLRREPELLDYVLYHEMLHKKHKFSETRSGRTRSHTKAFREEERRFRLADGSDPETRLVAFLRRARTQAF